MSRFALAPPAMEARHVLMIHVFLDDSGKESQQSAPFVCMAGYLGNLDSIARLGNRWMQMILKLGIPAIHMREIIPNYSKYGWDIAKRDEVLAECVQIIRESALTGVGVALEMAAWRKLRKEHPDLDFGTAQQFCLERILRTVIDRLHAAQIDELALVFDTDPEFGANRFNLFCGLLGHDERATRRLSSITFGLTPYYPGLQCADILAWETRKEMAQRLGGHASTKRWRDMFAAMPEYHLDYFGELWDDAEIERQKAAIIEIFRQRVSAASRRG